MNNPTPSTHTDMPKRALSDNDYCYSPAEEVFFYSIQEIFWYCYENQLEPQALELVHCKEEQLSELSAEYWEDDLGFDNDRYEIPGWLNLEIDRLNKMIRERPGSGVYVPTNVAAELTDELMQDWRDYQEVKGW